MFTFKNMNNGTLRSTKSMPQKDITSDNQSTFSMGRRKYVRTLGVDTTLVNNNIPDTIRKNIQKKWYGSSSTSDSTRVLNKRVNNEVGNGSLNASRTSMSFTSDSAIVPAIFNLNAIDGSGSATLTFNIDNGGSLITNYQYAIDGINSGNFKSLGPSINNPYLLPDSLTAGTSYKIYLKAFNKLGEGAADTSVVPSTLPRSAPSVPTIASLDYTNSIIIYNSTTSNDATRSVYFTPNPLSTGQPSGWSPIVSYKLLVKDSAGITIPGGTYTFSSGSTPIISGLKVVTNYILSLSAFNKHGEGPSSTNSGLIPILAVPPYNENLVASILVDASVDVSNISLHNRVNFTNPNVPTIDISFAITSAPTNNGGSDISGYNFNCPNITSTLSFVKAPTTYSSSRIGSITLKANTLNTINIYARNNIGIAPIPKQITYFPPIPPPAPIILSASITGTSAAYFLNVTFTGSNAYPIDSDISGYQSAIEFNVGLTDIYAYKWNNISKADTMFTSVTQTPFSDYYRRVTDNYKTSTSQDGLIYKMLIRPISKQNYFYQCSKFSQFNPNFITKTDGYISGNPPILNSVKYIPGDRKVVLYDFSLNPTSLVFLNIFVVYSYRTDTTDWSPTDLFVNATLPDNNNAYNLYVRAHNNIGISNTITIPVRGVSTPPTPVMAVYQYKSGVLLVATPGEYVSKYLDEVMYSYDKYSVTYSYSFDNSVYQTFPVYSTGHNRRQVFIKQMPSGTTFGGSTLTTDASLSLIGYTNYTLYLRSTSINSNVSSYASTNFTFTPVDISGIGSATSHYKHFKIGDLRYIIWPNSGSVTFNASGNIEILMIGGGGMGGGGGTGVAGGGGAGEVLNGFLYVSAGNNYNITMGVRSGATDGNKPFGQNGINTDFSGVNVPIRLTAYGGGSSANGDNTWANPVSYGSSGGGSCFFNNSGYGGATFLTGPVLNTRPYITSNNLTYILSYGGNSGMNGLGVSNALLLSGGGGGSATPARLSIDCSSNNPGAGTNKVSDWIIDISAQMDSIQFPNKNWSKATIKNNIGYIASGGMGAFNNSLAITEKIVNFNELTTSQVFNYGGGVMTSVEGVYNTGSGSSWGKNFTTSGLVVIRYYE